MKGNIDCVAKSITLACWITSMELQTRPESSYTALQVNRAVFYSICKSTTMPHIYRSAN